MNFNISDQDNNRMLGKFRVYSIFKKIISPKHLINQGMDAFDFVVSYPNFRETGKLKPDQ